MKTILSSVGLAAMLLLAFALPACAAGPGDNSPSTGPSVEPQRPQTTPANTTATFYYWDHLGTVRMTAGENPTVETVERHDYEPYGLEMLPATNQAGNTHQFTGHERDALGGASSVALDYMHFRYYGSNLGRFMKPDNGADQSPMNPQSWNLYSYVRGNPVNFNDPSGHYEEDVHRDLTTALAEAVGFDEKAAASIGGADQGVDDSSQTGAFASAEARRDFHFTDEDRRADLWRAFESSGSTNDLGVYLHAEQDSFSHAGYDYVRGHAAKSMVGFKPDKTYRDVAKANAMAADTYNALCKAAFRLGVSPGTRVQWRVISKLVDAFSKANTKADKDKVLAEIRDKAMENKQNNPSGKTGGKGHRSQETEYQH